MATWSPTRLPDVELASLDCPTVGVVGDPGLTAYLLVRWLDDAEIPGSKFRSKEILAQLQDYSFARDLGDKATANTVDIVK